MCKIKIMGLLILSMTAIWISLDRLNRFKEGFYFEKFNEKESAKHWLLNHHPIGSDVESLVRTLKKAGAYGSFFKKARQKGLN